MLLRILVVLFLLVTLAGGALAGEYYLSDQDAYWWYWDGSPDYEVLVPSKAYAYVQVDWGGQTFLQMAIDKKGPLLVVGTLPSDDVEDAWSALSARWAAAATNAKTTTKSTLETEQGLKAEFRLLEAKSQGNPNALVRMVAFKKGGRLAYLMFVGNDDQYTGDAKQYWLRAVHSFKWRG